MKLEIKHLAPYLPYDLKMIFEGKDGRIIELKNITKSELGIAISGGNGGMWLKSCGFKPILIPLSKMAYYSNGLRKLGYKADTDNEIQNIIDDIKNWKAEYDIMQMCFEEHIDVFGLIEAGLAIDKNTLNK